MTGPTGPEDSTPGVEFLLNGPQREAIADLTARHKGSIRLRDRGAGWVALELLDAEGEVIAGALITPTGQPPQAESPWPA